MMAELAADYDRLSKDAERLQTQKERDEQGAKRLRQQQAASSLLDAPFSHANAEQAIEAPFSHTRAR
jgi:hypothetical protein